MVDTKTKQIMVFAAIVLGIVIVIALLIRWVAVHDRNLASRLEAEAIPIGVAKAKQECQKEGLDPNICNSITGVASTSECEGKTCWIIYARSEDPTLFRASVTVHKQDNTFAVLHYLRDPNAHP